MSGREIKFRVWITKCKQMSLPYSIYRTNYNGCDPEDYILMQYTGLKDKNGKEIYEGDLLRCFGQIPCKKERNDHIGKISYFIHGFQIFLWDGKDWCAPKRISYCADQLEVIGNIYENPELL